MTAGRFKSIALVVLFFLQCTAFADTIWFQDGSFLRCKVNDEPVFFTREEDPNFIEVEIPYGLIGIRKNERIIKVEKDNLYDPGDKSMTLMDIFSMVGHVLTSSPSR